MKSIAAAGLWILAFYGVMFIWMYFAMGREFIDTRKNLELSCLQMKMGENLGLEDKVFCACWGETKATIMEKSQVELAARRASIYGYRDFVMKLSASAEVEAMQLCMMPKNG